MRELEKIYKLNNVKRWNGVFSLQQQSVSEHCFYCACISGMLVDIYNEVEDKHLDTEKVILRALYHDISESFLSHLTHEANNTSEMLKEEVERQKNKGYIEWCRSINRPDLCCDKNIGDIENILEFSDTFDAWMYAYMELEYGNQALRSAYERLTVALQKQKETYRWAKIFCERYLKEEKYKPIVCSIK